MNRLKSELQKLLDNELIPHERTLWVGQPIPKLMALSGLPLSVFSIVWLGFAGFMIYRVMAPFSGEIDLTQSIFAGLFIIIGLWMLVAPIRRLLKAGKIVYVVTNKRAFTIIATRRVSISYFAPKDIKNIEKKVNSDGSGDLILLKEHYIDRTGDNDSNRTRRTRRKGFFAVDDVKLVEESIRKMCAENP